MKIARDDIFSAQQTRKSVGRPAFVWAQLEMYQAVLQLHYPDLQIVVEMSADRDNCYINSINQDFVVDYVYCHFTLRTYHDFEGFGSQNEPL